MKILLIIPCYNEEKNINTVIENLNTHHYTYDYIIVNDCSTDRTKEICQIYNYNYLSFCTNLGIGGAVQAGYMYAVENSYDITVQVDGDGQHDPVYIEKMIEKLQEENSDMVIGSRFIENKGFQTSPGRRFGIKLINATIRFCCGIKVTDATSGFRVCSKSMTAFFAKNYAQDYPEPEAIVSAALNNYKVCEVPVEMKERKEGVSSINWIRSIYYMIKVVLALILQRIAIRRRAG